MGQFPAWLDSFPISPAPGTAPGDVPLFSLQLSARLVLGMSVPGSRPDMDLDLRQLMASLRSYFEPLPPTPLSEADFLDIQRKLGQHPSLKEWDDRPRTYALFRMLGGDQQSDHVTSFIKERLHDILLPWDIHFLPEQVKNNEVLLDRFLLVQPLVLSNPQSLVPANNSETHDVDAHRHITDGEAFFDIKKKLGSGGSGQVDAVISKLTGAVYARKRILRPSSLPFVYHYPLTEFEKELVVLRRLRCLPHMVQYVGSYTDLRWFALMMRPVAECDLQTFLGRIESVSSPEEDRQELPTFFGCLGKAVEALHESKIRHMDIKPRNILIKERRVMICDFGISRDWSGQTGDTTAGPDLKRTEKYCSPEVYDSMERNRASDIFSLGVVFLEIITVISGSRVKDMREYLSTHYTETDVVSQNLSAVEGWMEYLGQYPGNANEVPLAWVKDMVYTQSLLCPKIELIYCLCS